MDQDNIGIKPIDLEALLKGAEGERVKDPFFGWPVIQRRERAKETPGVTLFIIDNNLNGKSHEHAVLKRFLRSKEGVESVYTISTKSSLDTYSKIYFREDNEKVVCVVGAYEGIMTEDELEAFRKKHDAVEIILRYNNPRQFLSELAQHSTLTGIKFQLKNSQDYAPKETYVPKEIELTSATPETQTPELPKIEGAYEAPPPMPDVVGEILGRQDNELENILHPKSADKPEDIGGGSKPLSDNLNDRPELRDKSRIHFM